MADTVKVVMDQIDEETGKPISHVVCEWYGMDRNDANAMSMAIADGVVGQVTEIAGARAEIEGSGLVATALKTRRK